MSAARFSSVAAMPDRMRTMVEAQGRAVPHAPATSEAKKRAPSRDAEHIEQVAFFERIRAMGNMHPELALAADRTFAIPNGGGRTKREGGRLKAEGVRPGVSDIFCSVARHTYEGHLRHGLYIEMKSLIGNASREQDEWIRESRAQGYAAHVCRGHEAAVRAWLEYVTEAIPPAVSQGWLA